MKEVLVRKSVEPWRFEKRSKWYQINSLLVEMEQAGAELHLKPEDMIHVGGTANFYRFYQAFGSSSVPHYRGTHDMDLVSFRAGALGNVLDHLKLLHEREISYENRPKDNSRPKNLVSPGSPKLHRVTEYSTRSSTSIPDKKCIYLTLDYKDIPGTDSGFNVDLYEPSNNQIIFNHRILKADRLVLDPPESLELVTNRANTSRRLVSVPSLRDYFIMKTDVVDFSRSGLRPKDKFDVLTTLRVAKELGISIQSLFESLSLANDGDRLSRRSEALASLFDRPTQDIEFVPKDYPFLPDKYTIQEAAKLVKSLPKS